MIKVTVTPGDTGVEDRREYRLQSHRDLMMTEVNFTVSRSIKQISYLTHCGLNKTSYVRSLAWQWICLLLNMTSPHNMPSSSSPLLLLPRQSVYWSVKAIKNINHLDLAKYEATDHNNFNDKLSQTVLLKLEREIVEKEKINLERGREEKEEKEKKEKARHSEIFKC